MLKGDYITIRFNEDVHSFARIDFIGDKESCADSQISYKVIEIPSMTKRWSEDDRKLVGEALIKAGAFIWAGDDR